MTNLLVMHFATIFERQIQYFETSVIDNFESLPPLFCQQAGSTKKNENCIVSDLMSKEGKNG